VHGYEFGRRGDGHAGGQHADADCRNLMKKNADAEKSAVLTLLGEQSPQPDLAAGVGGNLDISV
jgi:hypothetical protein